MGYLSSRKIIVCVCVGGENKWIVWKRNINWRVKLNEIINYVLIYGWELLHMVAYTNCVYIHCSLPLFFPCRISCSIALFLSPNAIYFILLNFANIGIIFHSRLANSPIIHWPKFDSIVPVWCWQMKWKTVDKQSNDSFRMVAWWTARATKILLRHTNQEPIHWIQFSFCGGSHFL